MNFLNKKKYSYKNINIVYKPHPKTPKQVIDLIIKSFPKSINIVSKNILSEFLLIDDNSLYFGAFLSSSLIYASILNKNIKIFFFDIENQGVKEFDAQSKNMRIICTKNNIESLYVD